MQESPKPQRDDPLGPDWLYRLRERAAGDSRFRLLLWRVAATTLGVLIVLAGIVMLPLPGPGWVVIFLGLAVLATEYVWAHRLLIFTRDKAQTATSSAFSPQHRKRTTAILVALLLFTAAVIALYVAAYGWTWGGVRGWLGLG